MRRLVAVALILVAGAAYGRYPGADLPTSLDIMAQAEAWNRESYRDYATRESLRLQREANALLATQVRALEAPRYIPPATNRPGREIIMHGRIK